jgi:hypothetical protein
MSPISQASVPPSVALLCATTVTEAGDAILVVGGEIVLAHQISALRGVGIRKFLIEVDSVSGALLALTDKLKLSGCSVDFVRSAQDLQVQLGEVPTFVVQAEGIYANPDLLATMLSQSGSFIATIDGRSENEAFERMDLNTRWAGFAVLPRQTANGIGALPVGWSIASSLLRQSMQDGVVQIPAKQSCIQEGKLRRISSVADAAALSSEILSRRAGHEPGFIESRMFGPVAASLAPILWRLNSHASLIDGAVLLMGVLTLGLASLGWITSAGIAAIVAIFTNSVRQTLANDYAEKGLGGWAEHAMWLLLAIALVWSGSSDAYRPSDGYFASGVVVGLAVLGRQLTLPNWARKTLQSPALIALSLVLLTLITGISGAAKWVGFFQLALLVTAKWSHRPRA